METARPPAFFVVAFRERGPLETDGEAGKTASVILDRDAESRGQELRGWQARYQATSNELEAYIENTKSVTEEFQSVNEELQSSNEELETAKQRPQDEEDDNRADAAAAGLFGSPASDDTAQYFAQDALL